MMKCNMEFNCNLNLTKTLKMNKTKNKIESSLIQNYISVDQIKFNKLFNNSRQETINSTHYLFKRDSMFKKETIPNKNLSDKKYK